ncbi:MAG: hypothetical protein O9311_16235 [Cytophagales bacterium]|nr:hypothetical protein [Cytophagales bacterium]
MLHHQQRLLYIIGEVFGGDHRLRAEWFSITPANDQVKLQRAQSDLLNFVFGICGIITPCHPYRCPKKARV